MSSEPPRQPAPIEGMATHDIHGRDVRVTFGKLDDFGQFPVRVFVDTTMVFEGYFTDKSEDRREP